VDGKVSALKPAFRADHAHDRLLVTEEFRKLIESRKLALDRAAFPATGFQ
jgi:hypothetical protein